MVSSAFDAGTISRKKSGVFCKTNLDQTREGEDNETVNQSDRGGSDDSVYITTHPRQRLPGAGQGIQAGRVVMPDGGQCCSRRDGGSTRDYGGDRHDQR